jgi:hypothetical protein
MGILALDIETASPFEEPPADANDTAYFEWLSVALAYAEAPGEEPETTVLFRRGGWEREHTADLLDRFLAWCDGRTVDVTLTYNGASFDLKHIANWAAALAAAGTRPGALEDVDRALPEHVDLALAAADRHREELWDDQVVLPDWKAYQLEGIDATPTRYRDFEFNDDVFARLGIDDDIVKGAHVGRVLGEWYVEGVREGLEDTHTHRELRRLLVEYSLGDVVYLPRLYESLGGGSLHEQYHVPLEDVGR